jgi:uncharacterized protein YjgD (DUF1641 family)
MLKGDEGALIAAAGAGRTHHEIAAEAEVSVSTVQRRLRDPDITAAIREARLDKGRQAAGRLNTDLNAAIDKLRELVEHEDPRIALSAIDKLIAHAHRFTAKWTTPSGGGPENEEGAA